MQIAKWGNSLGVRLPAHVVKSMKLKPGTECEVVATDEDGLYIRLSRAPDERTQSHLEALKRFRGRMPEGFVFDRDAANER